MKKLKAKYVSASESGGEYFQVIFEEKRDSLTNYFLIQRAFEFEEDEGPDPPYLESDEEKLCGHLAFQKVEFDRNRFYIQLADEEKHDLEVSFDISEENYQEVKRLLKIILTGYDFVKIQ
ncbi:hypothetical protein GWO43_11565 [candidate division KSB1 bacterium]|nr:hypothetical protein [candidate division KSB1 bacterium]NIR70736.1 hypothetical protein [candidate division KSB1 bacterium]NIS24594.1 hypothetical protein [candidate division KSB1 bacterium]NIT71503.1 hypothetical protein [candidate division KSB1 bacterium]NIU25194.1 hypothetical protein [candidate division KSB1 bacterium]